MPRCLGRKPSFVRCSNDAQKGRRLCYSHRNQPQKVIGFVVITLVLGVLANWLAAIYHPFAGKDVGTSTEQKTFTKPGEVAEKYPHVEPSADRILAKLSEMPLGNAELYASKTYLKTIMEVELSGISSHTAMTGGVNKKTGKLNGVWSRKRWEGTSKGGTRFSCTPNPQTEQYLEGGDVSKKAWSQPVRGKIKRIKLSVAPDDSTRTSIEMIELVDCFFPHLK